MNEPGHGTIGLDKNIREKNGVLWEFSDKAVTAWGGMRLIQELLVRMGFREMLRGSGLPEPKSNRGYNPVDVLESFMVCVWVGGVRFSHTAMVRFDEALCGIFKWKQVASVATFTRFFRRFNRDGVDEVYGRINRWFWSQIPSKVVTVDLDSSVVTRYGKQEGAVKGYNSNKKGRPSHNPIFAFVADLRLVLHCWLRPGNSSSGNGVSVFFKEARDLLGERHRVGLIRADSGFFAGEFMDDVESQGINYIIAVRMNRVIRGMISGITNWTIIDKGIGVSEICYKAHSWSKERRIIIVRQNEDELTEARGRYLFEMSGYRYQSYVSDLALPAVEVWRLYRGRADSENRIAELKYDFGATGFCLHSFYATEAALRTALLAYNLMSIFRQALLQAPKAVTLATMRFECFAIGSSLGRNGRSKVLRISLSPQRRLWFEGLFAKIHNLTAPWPIT